MVTLRCFRCHKPVHADNVIMVNGNAYGSDCARIVRSVSLISDEDYLLSLLEGRQ